VTEHEPTGETAHVAPTGHPLNENVTVVDFAFTDDAVRRLVPSPPEGIDSDVLPSSIENSEHAGVCLDTGDCVRTAPHAFLASSQ